MELTPVVVSIVLFFLFFGWGRLKNRELSYLLARERRHLFENIGILAAGIALAVYVLAYILSGWIDSDTAFAISILMLIAVWILSFLFKKRSVPAGILAKRKRAFPSLPIKRWKRSLRSIRKRGYGTEPVFGPDGSIVAVEPKRLTISALQAENIKREIASKKIRLSSILSLMALAQRLEIEIPDGEIDELAIRSEILDAALHRAEKGEAIACGQVLQHCSGEEAGFVYLLMGLRSGKIVPAAIPWALIFRQKLLAWSEKR